MSGVGIFHPDFFYMPRPTVNSAQLAKVRVLHPTGATAHWVPGSGISTDMYDAIWEGQARLQPNKDWRARPREVQNEYGAVHAIRVQLPIGMNLFGATYDENDQVTAYGPEPAFSKDDVVLVLESPVIGSETLVGDRYVVRNAKNSANLWLHNLLCDTETKE